MHLSSDRGDRKTHGSEDFPLSWSPPPIVGLKKPRPTMGLPGRPWDAPADRGTPPRPIMGNPALRIVGLKKAPCSKNSRRLWESVPLRRILCPAEHTSRALGAPLVSPEALSLDQLLLAPTSIRGDSIIHTCDAHVPCRQAHPWPRRIVSACPP